MKSSNKELLHNEKPYSRKMRRLNQDLIVLGVILAISTLVLNFISKGSLDVSGTQWLVVLIGINLAGVGLVWHPMQLADRYEALLPWKALDGKTLSPARNSRHSMLLLVACLVVVFWQSTFSIASAQLDKKYKITETAGIFGHSVFVYYYYYLDLFPVYAAGIEPNYSETGAEKIAHEYSDSLRMETTYQIRGGDLGKVWLYLPEAFVKGEPRGVQTFWFNGWLFTFGLLAILIAMWYVDQFALGILLVAFIGSQPLQLYEAYADVGYGGGQVFSVNISVVLLVMALHIPLIFSRKVHKFYLWALPIISGLFLATVRQVRTEPVVIIVSVAACYMFVARQNWRTRGMLILLLFGSFWVGSGGWQKYFDYKINQASEFVSQAGGHPYNGLQRQYHVFWHPIWCGLGDFDRKYGYVWGDTAAFKYAYPILKAEGKIDFEMIGTEQSTATYDAAGVYPKYIWELPEYETILRDKVLGDIRNDPEWYLGILAKRVNRIITDIAPARISFGGRHITLPVGGILLIPTLALLIFVRRWSLLKLLCFPLPLATTALVVYSGGGSTYYSIFPQVLMAIYVALFWIGLQRGYAFLQKRNVL